MKTNEAEPTARKGAGSLAEAPKTLAELGVSGALAAEFEAMFRTTGRTQGDRVIGFTFTTTDGAQHLLRLGSKPGPTGETDPTLEHAA